MGRLWEVLNFALALKREAMSAQEIFALARQGDPVAIGTLLSLYTKSQGIKMRVHRQDQHLRVLIEGDELPNQQRAIDLIQTQIKALNVESIQTITVYGRQRGSKFPEWQQDIQLKPDPDLQHSASIIVTEASHNSAQFPGAESNHSSPASPTPADLHSAPESGTDSPSEQTDLPSGEADLAPSETDSPSEATNLVPGETTPTSGETAPISGVTNSISSETNSISSETNSISSETAPISGETDLAPSETNLTSSETAPTSAETDSPPAEAAAISGETNLVPGGTNLLPSETSPLPELPASSTSSSEAAAQAKPTSRASDTPDLLKRPEAVIFILFVTLFVFWDAYVSFLDDVESSSILSSGQLARRLNTSRSTIRRLKRQDSFSEWTRSRDPDRIAWVYQKGVYAPSK